MAKTQKSYDIILITRHFPPQIDGVGDYTYRLAQAHAADGLRVCVLTSPPTSMSRDEFDVMAWSGSWGRMGLWGLTRLLKSLQGQCIHLQYVPHMYGRWGVNWAIPVLLWLQRWWFKTKTVATLHEMCVGWNPLSLHLLFLGIINRLQVLFLCLAAHDLIRTSPEHLRSLSKLGPFLRKKICWIPLFSNISRLNISDKQRAQVRDELGVKQDEILLGTFAGRLRPDLCLESAIEAAKILSQHGEVPRLLFIGAMSSSARTYEAEIQRLGASLPQPVIWTGSLPPEEISRRLGALDLYLHLTSEGATMRSTTLLAALAHCVPILVGEAPKASSLEEFAEAAVVVHPLTAERLAAAIEELLADKARASLLRTKARVLCERQFHPVKVARKVQQVCVGTSQQRATVRLRSSTQ